MYLFFFVSVCDGCRRFRSVQDIETECLLSSMVLYTRCCVWFVGTSITPTVRIVGIVPVSPQACDDSTHPVWLAMLGVRSRSAESRDLDKQDTSEAPRQPEVRWVTQKFLLLGQFVSERCM